MYSFPCNSPQLYNEVECCLTFYLVLLVKSLSSFEYVEPNGKDMGINVRKKVESIVSLLNNKEKIQEVRNKAAANRDKYVMLQELKLYGYISF